MENRILALVDGSIYSRSVCDHAAWLALRTGGAVELLHVLGRREGAGRADLSGAIALGSRTALLEELAALDEQRAKLGARRGRAILDDALGILKAAGVPDATAHLRHGDVLETVAERERDASLLVIGKRGEAADFARGHLGSNIERVVRASARPVLVASRAFRPIGRVLVAHDGGAGSKRAVEHVARSGAFAGLDVRVVTVGGPSDPARQALAEARARLAASGLEAATEILPGQPEAALAQRVEAAGIDLVVMGAYGGSRLRSLFVGSTTSELVRSCRVPVLLVR